jgi:hypothetical protein
MSGRAALVVIDETAEEGRERSYYHKNHAIALRIIRSDPERSGLFFLESRPGFRDPKQKDDGFFLVFEKP